MWLKEIFLYTRLVVNITMVKKTSNNKKNFPAVLALAIVVIAAVVILSFFDRTEIETQQPAETQPIAPVEAKGQIVQGSEIIEGILREIRDDAFILDQDGKIVMVSFSTKDFTVVQKIPGGKINYIGLEELRLRSKVQIIKSFDGTEQKIKAVIMEGVETTVE